MGSLALALSVAACGGEARSLHAAADVASTTGAATDAPDRVIAGRQGGRGQFVVECAFDRFLADDPIVHPGAAGASHLHQFFGAVGVSVGSTHDEMLAGPTTCDQQADTASYWTPVLLDPNGRPIEPLGSVAYYRAGPDVAPNAVVPFPPGLMMVAGDHTAMRPQALAVVAWSCGAGGRRDVRPPACESSSRLRMTVTFPDCWNGVDVRSPIVSAPSMHVAYSTAGTCPDGHPVHIPQLQFAVDFPPVPEAEVGALALSSGDILTGHADFWNVWDQAKLRREVVACLHRDLACGIGG